MRVFELENNLGSDSCTLINRELANTSIFNHNIYNNFFTSDCKDDNKKMVEFMTDNPNLHYRDGYGFTNSCVIDNDSELRNNSKVTHDRSKIQLCSRWNLAVPDLGRGGLLPNTESKLKNAEDTSYMRNCDKVSEKYFNRNIPLIGCLAPTIQNPEHIIMPYTRGGDITRNYVFNNVCGGKKAPQAPGRGINTNVV